jgi:hypothetical protein
MAEVEGEEATGEARDVVMIETEAATLAGTETETETDTGALTTQH